MKTTQTVLLLIAVFTYKINGQDSDMWKTACQVIGRPPCEYTIQSEIAGYYASSVTPAETATCLKHTSKTACEGDTNCSWCDISSDDANKMVQVYAPGVCVLKKLSDKLPTFCASYIGGLAAGEAELSKLTTPPKKPGFAQQAECIEKSDSKTDCEAVKDGDTNKCKFCVIPTTYNSPAGAGYCAVKTFADTKQAGELDLCEQIAALSQQTTVAPVTTTAVSITDVSTENTVTTNGSFQNMLSASIISIVLSVWAYTS